MMLNNNAVNQPSTVKPGTISAAHFTIRMLITNKNNPSVTMVIGMVSMINNGLMNYLANPIPPPLLLL